MTTNYYQIHKERFQKEVQIRYQNLSEGEKDKREKMFQGRYQNLYEEEEKTSVSSGTK